MDSSINQFNNQVEKTINNVKETSKTEGTQAAYKELRKEYENFIANPNHSQSEDKAFIQNVAYGLNDQMVGLSAAWGLNQLQAKEVTYNQGSDSERTVTEYSSHGHDLTPKTILNDGNLTDVNANGQIMTPFDQVMAQELASNFDQFHHSKPVLGLFGHAYLSHDTLLHKIDKIDKANFKEQALIRNQNEDVNIAQSLMANNNELFATLDGINNQEPTGKIHRDNLKKFIKDVETNPNGVIAQSFDTEQISMVYNLEKNWDSEQIKILHPDGYISFDSMANALGYSDTQSMYNNLERR